MTEDVDIQNEVRQDISLVPNLVEETLRYYPPIQAIGRIAAEDVELGECKIKKGQQVISWAASANRDSAKFERSNTFVVRRKTNPHVSFGFGIHFCLGAPLARMEGKIAFAKLLEKGEFSKVQNQSLKPIDSPFVFGVKNMKLLLTTPEKRAQMMRLLFSVQSSIFGPLKETYRCPLKR